MTTEQNERSIKDLMREKPDAYNFDDITEAVPGKSSAGTSATLTQVLGGFEFFARDPVTGLSFYGRKPKVYYLKRLIDLINTPIVSDPEDTVAMMNAVFDRSCEVAALLLYVQINEFPAYGAKAGDGWRPATVEEVGKAFDLKELSDARDKFSGLAVAETTEGNA